MCLAFLAPAVGCVAGAFKTDRLLAAVDGMLGRYKIRESAMHYTDITQHARTSCFEVVRTLPVGSSREILSRVMRWLEQNKVTIYDSPEDMRADEGEGFRALVQDSSVRLVINAQKRRPVLHRWRLGGLWSGMLTIRGEDPLLPPTDQRTLSLGECSVIPEFNATEWAAHPTLERARWACADVAVHARVHWPLPHTHGPAIKRVSSSHTSREFATPTSTSSAALPWAVLLDGRMMVYHEGPRDELPEDWRDLSWRSLVKRCISRSKLQSATCAVLDLEVDSALVKPIK